MYKLDPYLDYEGLLRVGGRIRMAALPIDPKHPILLPKECHLTQLIIGHFQEQHQQEEELRLELSVHLVIGLSEEHLL